MFGDITTIINQGIFLTSQNQILDKSTKKIWGYIILNGTDVLTITAVLGYVVQKFISKKFRLNQNANDNDFFLIGSRSAQGIATIWLPDIALPLANSNQAVILC